MPESAPVRPGEELDVSALAAYLRGKLEGIEAGLEVEQFPGGHSNLTYLLRAGGREFVLRRPPLGPVAPKAHDMAREFAVLRAVHPVFAPAPAVHVLCEDVSVIGATFFVMERRRGIILRDPLPPCAHPWIAPAFIDCLARLHAVDIERHGLRALGKPEGFLERQVRGWAERWGRAHTDDAPAADGIIAWLVANLPVSGAPTLVHNDYKLDNVMLSAEKERVEAVLDWEMATVGDPLADLGCTLCYWPHPAFIERYAEQTNRDMTHVEYYRVFGTFKLAVILQQIYYRWRRGQTQDERFRCFDERVRGLMLAAEEAAARA